MAAGLSLRVDLDAVHEADSLGFTACMTFVVQVSDGGDVRRGGADDPLLCHVHDDLSGARGSVAAIMQSGRRRRCARH